MPTRCERTGKSGQDWTGLAAPSWRCDVCHFGDCFSPDLSQSRSTRILIVLTRKSSSIFQHCLCGQRHAPDMDPTDGPDCNRWTVMSPLSGQVEEAMSITLQHEMLKHLHQQIIPKGTLSDWTVLRNEDVINRLPEHCRDSDTLLTASSADSASFRWYQMPTSFLFGMVLLRLI
ncbi:hypothetical protein E5288_WYG004282 [Bos mutus]|uniref:Uncharacterized protein n=1 Tax=Bos mutus TaxID=72004 RepID=A0A6B0R738_9CETA|nr:hypothetical protein [Bos mutus]